MIDFLIQYGYWGFFLASFLSATILPFSSELILTGLLISGSSPWACIILGTIGNTLGGLTCYWLGSKGKIEWIEKYLGVREEQLLKIYKWVEKKGAVMAFFSFLPVIGDVINIALGYLHSNIKYVTFFMTLGKCSRYVIWMYLNNYIIQHI